AGVLIRPAMVRTTEMGSITLLRPADQRPTMPTTIKQKPDPALLITNKNKRILTHITQAIITRTRNLRLMTHITPSPSKHPLQLKTMNLRIVEDTSWDESGVQRRRHLLEHFIYVRDSIFALNFHAQFAPPSEKDRQIVGPERRVIEQDEPLYKLELTVHAPE